MTLVNFILIIFEISFHSYFFFSSEYKCRSLCSNFHSLMFGTALCLIYRNLSYEYVSRYIYYHQNIANIHVYNYKEEKEIVPMACIQVSNFNLAKPVVLKVGGRPLQREAEL